MATKSTSNSKIITCKGAVVWGKGEGVKVEEIQVDPPKSSEVRVKMLFASLCHTDLLCCDGHPLPLFPRIPGHEGVGIVESVGEGVREVKEGDTVMPTYIGECGECANCSSSVTNSNLCLTHPLPFDGLMPDGTSRLSKAATTTTTAAAAAAAAGDPDQKQMTRIYHHFTCSTWCEYIVIDVHYVVKLDPRIPLPHASFLSCGYSTGFGATFKQVVICKGSTVAVLGLGAVGLGVVEGARMQGAGRIIGVDINERKREKGLVFGITDFINPSTTTTDSDSSESKSEPDDHGKHNSNNNNNNHNKASISEMVKELTGGMGVDYCFECTGVPSLVNQALLSTKLGIGTAVAIGSGNEKSGEIDLVPLLCGRTLKGSIFGGIKVKSDLPFILHKCINKELKLDELLTHQISLDEINKAFHLMKQPDCVKVLIKF
ncbi:unnamed protein product [Camellia sinensis]